MNTTKRMPANGRFCRIMAREVPADLVGVQTSAEP